MPPRAGEGGQPRLRAAHHTPPVPHAGAIRTPERVPIVQS